MPRRKIIRTVEEEEEFVRIRRERTRARNNANQCQRRQRQASINDASCSHIVINEVENIRLNSQNEFETSNLPIPVQDVDIVGLNNCERQRRFRAIHGESSNIQHLNIECCNEISEHYIGRMEVMCIHCGARHFSQEKVANKGNSFNDCCSHGSVLLDAMPDFPIELRELFEANHPKSNDFYKRIRCYNSSFSFASFNANLFNFGVRRPGPYCFKIQGQIYYQVNTSLYSATNEPPSYGQLFIVDPNEATEHRLNHNSELDDEIVRTLDRIMRQYNIFAQSYQMMGEELANQRRLSLENNEPVPELSMLFTLKPGVDRRRYNFQRTNEVAAVFFTTADGEIPESYVCIRNRNDKVLQQVSSMDPNVEPWIYPLFYPCGSRGWHRNLMRLNSNRRVSRLAYVKYRLSIRDDFNPFIMGRRLFQQWAVDNYVKIEKDRIEYCKGHQKELRAESYNGLIDYLQNTANDVNGRVGKMIILPSSFIGSPRNMMQNYQDAMAIVRKYGKPDLFITMTCNPSWKEIRENLLTGQQAADRPDICARVFSIKKNALIDLIVKKKCFGEVAAYVYVVEFQKRGLPHIHMLVTLRQNYKITTPSIVDRYISAEIPDPSENRVLHDIVMRHMIHGPCGEWCLVDGKCSKHYPRSLCEETTMDVNGYPSYRRKDTGDAFFERPGGYSVNNRYVVPYCPMLLSLFNSHINVEIVSSIKSVKYLYKYIYKGHDSATLTIGEIHDDTVINHDEIRDYIDSRYVGPVEAVWRILSKTLHDKSHAISRLPVHLPNEQNITINVGADENELMNTLDQATMLLDYFALNSRDVQARQYLYVDIPSHYTFQKQKDCNGKNVSHWKPRKAHFNCIGRMYAVSPTQIELFHLRLLLLTIRGATSFEYLRTVDGELQQTFTTTCLKLGLIEDDEEWSRAMHEAEVWMMPRQLRRLFVRILIHCQPVHPVHLWEEFKVAMSEDYAQSSGSLVGQNKSYAQINAMLCAEGRSLSDFPEMMQLADIVEMDDCISLQQAMENGTQQYKKLNAKQKEIVDVILNVSDNKNNNANTCYYIDGPGGSGKTFLYITLWNLLKGKNKRVITMAFTGIAAVLLPNGKTVHKTFGLPVPLFADSSSNIKLQSTEAKYLKDTDIFIMDEAPMAPKYALEVMNRTLQDIINNNLPFGGKIVILSGDFRQLLPIKLHSTRSETVNLSIKFSTVWHHFVKYSLTENMRTLPNEVDFRKFLIDLGDGVLNDANDNMSIPECCIASIDADIVEDTFGTLLRNKRYREAAGCAILSARNVDVDEINERVVKLLEIESEKVYTSVDSTENCNDNDDIGEILLTEYLNTLNPPSLPPHELRLRVNSVVMLIRNLSIHEGLCNGTRLLILDLRNNLLRCEILTGDRVGEIVFLNRITLYCENNYPFTFKRRQFPIKLAFAMTINKSQGQTFTKIGLDLRKDVFNHGQLYVACSRVRSWDSLRIYLGNQRDDRIVKNYVYKELY